MIEEWRPISGYELEYQVSPSGLVRSVERRCRTSRGHRKVPARVMRPWKDKDGYSRVMLCLDGVRRCHYVHRLVAIAHIGERPSEGHVVCHWNGDPADNRVENLRWGTYSENEADKKRHGIVPFSRKGAA